MAGVRVTHHTDRLAADMAKIPAKARVDMRATVREAGKVGNTLAKDFAKRSSGKHAKLYAREFTSAMIPSLFGVGSRVISVQYGPEARGQGLLAPILENGSRNNKPHLNLARSADVIGPAFAGEVRRLPDRWFW